MDNDSSEALRERVRAAISDSAPLSIVGGGSKGFSGRAPTGDPLEVAGHRGIVSYEPTELVITARGGTPLAEVRAALAERGQMLAFEPPAFGADATLGGCVAAGLSGPARPYAGAVRDFMLGAKVMNGRGEILRFGGEVMKNVAGYDVSRLMTGAWGTLGVLLELSLKVLPRPKAIRTLVFEMEAGEAIERCNAWAAKPFPISAACHFQGRLRVRLAGSASAIDAASRSLGANQAIDAVDHERSEIDLDPASEPAPEPEGEHFWAALREQKLAFFAGEAEPLWRISLPPGTARFDIDDDQTPRECLIDWGGGLRWIRGDTRNEAQDMASIRLAATRCKGHATLFRGGDRQGDIFHPLPAGLHRLHERIKAAFDPGAIFNRGRMYRGI
ncbi:MAG: glycolate oxidase subunit GlcE [Ectothiorhodospiraceae bacterium AqS1]|nr:glycolate oxidase subunit GlcE [Ectothiorhodospiraceae bacterium AqS1]MBF2761675.1 glycolate oxidase subunit GlcE [Ectothiorhodospiraceae bacterium AqS1]